MNDFIIIMKYDVCSGCATGRRCSLTISCFNIPVTDFTVADEVWNRNYDHLVASPHHRLLLCIESESKNQALTKIQLIYLFFQRIDVISPFRWDFFCFVLFSFCALYVVASQAIGYIQQQRKHKYGVNYRY